MLPTIRLFPRTCPFFVFLESRSEGPQATPLPDLPNHDGLLPTRDLACPVASARTCAIPQPQIATYRFAIDPQLGRYPSL